MASQIQILGERRFLAIALGATALGLFVRAWGIGDRPLWLDEAYSAWFSGRSWYELWFVVPQYETHPPAYYSLLKLWRGLFGDDPASLRWMSGVFGTATVLLSCLAAREMERLRPSPSPALHVAAAGLLAALASHAVFMGQEARPYAVLTAAYALAIYALICLFADFRTAEARAGSLANWLLLGIGTAATLWLHALGIVFAFVLFVALAAAALSGSCTSRWQRFAATSAIVALVYLPCAHMLFLRASDWGSGWLTWHSRMLAGAIEFYTVPLRYAPLVGLVAMVPLLLLAFVSVRQAVVAPGRQPTERALLLLWLGPLAIAAIISAVAMPVFMLRTMAPTLIPAFLLWATALAHIREARKRSLLAGLCALALVAGAAMTLQRDAQEPWAQISAFVATNASREDEIWIYPNDSALPLMDAARRAGHRYPIRPVPGDYPAVGFPGPVRAGSPAVPSLTRDQALAFVSGSADAPTIWLVARQADIFDPRDDLPAALSAGRTEGEPYRRGYISVTPYRRPPR